MKPCDSVIRLIDCSLANPLFALRPKWCVIMRWPSADCWSIQSAAPASSLTNPQEFKLLSDLYRKQIARYTKDKVAAEKLISAGEAPVPRDLAVPEMAAWTSVSRVVLNLHETITRY